MYWRINIGSGDDTPAIFERVVAVVPAAPPAGAIADLGVVAVVRTMQLFAN